MKETNVISVWQSDLPAYPSVETVRTPKEKILKISIVFFVLFGNIFKYIFVACEQEAQRN